VEGRIRNSDHDLDHHGGVVTISSSIAGRAHDLREQLFRVMRGALRVRT
jgi:hypothetical protein